MLTKIEYAVSWTFIGTDLKRRWKANKITIENDKTVSIETIKSFTTKEQAEKYCDKLSKETK